MSAVLEDPAPHFRPMRNSDLDIIIEVEGLAHAFPWSTGIFRDCLRVGYCCWVMERGDRIDAYGVMSVGAGESHLLNLCVRYEAQGKGLGRQMLQHMIDLARRHHCETILLEVRPSNPAAVSLYESEGFHEVGTRKDYYPAYNGREDALILARALI